jgi:hypothetical protein
VLLVRTVSEILLPILTSIHRIAGRHRMAIMTPKNRIQSGRFQEDQESHEGANT